ncbi:MAG: DUF1016 N-terminal domain-containing protein [Candidatus Omnitrophica bacterium]|nr:DUF1016 N-terminal domain-containing protein [Candidatus Omnitrophota bacterium]
MRQQPFSIQPVLIERTPDYLRLFRKIRSALARGARKVEQVKVSTFWQVGKSIDQYILKHQSRAPLGTRLLASLAQDLGITKTCLYYCLEFARAYPVFPALGKLNWTHFRELLSINNSNLRNQLTERAAKENWSSRTLKRKILELKAGKEAEKVLACLIPRKGKTGIYRILPWKEGEVYDLGFSCYLKIKTQKPSQVRPDKTFLYTYQALVEDVVDGDTLWAKIHLGFGVWTRQKLRLRGVNAFELSSAPGRRAKEYVERFFSKRFAKEPVIIATTRSDKYDRYLVDVFRGKRYLNQELLDCGLAELDL